MATTLYLIRHAEAEGNLYRRCQGHFDGRITRRGMAQIDALTERFRDVPIDAIYSSDLTRTRTTAQAVLRTHSHLQLQLEPRLREICMGDWEDQAWGDMERKTPEMVEWFSTDPGRWSVPGGESFSHLGERILTCVTELARHHEGQTIAVVSHGMAIRTLLCLLQGLPSEEVHRIPHGDNTAVHRLTWDGTSFSIDYFNDNSHLPPELSPFAHQTWWKGRGKDRYNLSFLPMDPARDRQIYLDCYAESWCASHGSLEGFVPELYWTAALTHLHNDPEAICLVHAGTELAGLVHLDTLREAESGIGWITLFYLREAHRGRGLAVQLLGHSISRYRRLGRQCLRLHTAPENQTALGFYEHYDFQKIGQEAGTLGPLYLLERKL